MNSTALSIGETSLCLHTFYRHVNMLFFSPVENRFFNADAINTLQLTDTVSWPGVFVFLERFWWILIPCSQVQKYARLLFWQSTCLPSGRQSKQGLILAATVRKRRRSLAENWLMCLEKLAQE